MRAARTLAVAWVVAVSTPRTATAADGGLVSRATAVMKRHCFKCHSGPDPEAGIDLARLLGAPSFAGELKTWRRVATALDKKRMPPEDEAQPRAAARRSLVSIIRQRLDREAPPGWPTFEPVRSFPLRRLTTEQYVASVRSVLGVGVERLPRLEPISPVQGFSAIAASIAGLSSTGVGQFESVSRFLARAAFAVDGPGRKLLSCRPSARADDPCLRSFVTSFGLRAFRRPLGDDEIDSYAAVTADVAASSGDGWKGIETIASAFLQSPKFLYLTEVGEPDPRNPGRYRFTSYEMASRLSYFLTGAPPDDVLLEAAASGALLTQEGVRAQAERLLALPSAHDAVRTFFGDLLALDALEGLGRSSRAFPNFTATLGPAMKQETLLVIDDLVFGRDGDYRRLFDQNVTFVNKELAALYGLPSPSGGGFERVVLPAQSGRIGLLGQAGVLVPRDNGNGTSPTKRGLFVLTRLLCQDLPLSPPANVQIPAPPSGRLTGKQRLEQHVSNAVCAGCHRPTDGVGLSLERFDALGAHRDTDSGLPIDDTGELDGKRYQGVAGLGATLRDHPALGPCLVQSLYSVAVGHAPTAFDRPSFGAIVKAFETGGNRIRPLLVAISASDGFRYLPAP